MPAVLLSDPPLRELIGKLRIIRARLIAASSPHIKYHRVKSKLLDEYQGLRAQLESSLGRVEAEDRELLELCGEAFALVHEEAPWQRLKTRTPAKASVITVASGPVSAQALFSF